MTNEGYADDNDEDNDDDDDESNWPQSKPEAQKVQHFWTADNSGKMIRKYQENSSFAARVFCSIGCKCSPGRITATPPMYVFTVQFMQFLF